ncbi:MAG: hypothetical protein V1731_02665 [Candidatus Aenigmatarchaeota archaeon]
MFGKLVSKLKGPRTIYTVAETHPDVLVKQALDEVGQLGNVAEEPIGEGNYTPYQIEFYPLYKMIEQSGAEPKKVDRALRKVTTACKILLRERDAIERLKPDVIYVEGSKKYSHPMAAVAKEHGAKVVHLDEGFEPYEKYASGETGFEDVQKGREAYWSRAIKRNFMSYLRGQKEVIVAGRNHIYQSFFHKEIGLLPQMLEQNGIHLKNLYDARRTMNAG